MASLSKEGSGWRILFVCPTTKKRRTIRTGRCAKKDAEVARSMIERLVDAKRLNSPVRPIVTEWLLGLDPKLLNRLANTGLIEPRESATLGEFTQRYVDSRVDLKPLTIRHLKQARTNLVDFFGEDKAMGAVTPADADRFRLYLVGKGLAPNTVRRRMGRGKQYFKAAVRSKLIAENPFDGQKTQVQGNAEKFVFITQQDSQKVLDACPDAEWRLIFALARYGGLRTPSETLALLWDDVDWGQDRILVRSCKTEHHEGGETRIIPIFAELRPHLEQAWELAPPRAVHAITRYRDTNINLRTQLHRIIRKAGLEPWVKPFQNLRSTRQTELAGQYPSHVVCRWLGNSQPVAMKHYLQDTDEFFEKAAQRPVENLAHFPAQSPSESAGQGRTENKETPKNSAVFGGCPVVYTASVPPVGLEPTTR